MHAQRLLAQLVGAGRLSRLASLALLGMGFCAGSFFVYFSPFVDEGDNLAGGWLVGTGAVLYRDLFSHHMPLPYYWLAGVFGVLGPSVLVARLSVLFFNLLAFAVLMRATRRFVMVGLAALGWGAVGHLFGGQMVVYSTLAATSLTVAAGLGLTILTTSMPPTRFQMAALGGYGALAVLADIIMLPAVLGVMLALAMHPPARRRWRLSCVWLVLPFGVWLGYLLLTRSLVPAFDGIIRFNAEVYARYAGLTAPGWLLTVLSNAASALFIWKPSMWQLLGHTFGPADHLTPVARFWFGGFLFRAAILVAVGLLLARRRWLAASLVYGLASLTVARAELWFRLQPFALLALVTAAIVTARWLDERPLQAAAPSSRRGALRRPAVTLVLLMLLGWPSVLGFRSLVQLRDRLAYADNFANELARAAAVERIAAGQDAPLGFYPGDPIVNFLTRRHPPAGTLYLWPWVADQQQGGVIAALKTEPAIVFLNVDQAVWGKPVAGYLADLRAFLDQQYVMVEPNYYVAPQLLRR